MKRWLFNTKLESQLCRDEAALNFTFWEVGTFWVHSAVCVAVFVAHYRWLSIVMYFNRVILISTKINRSED